VLVVTIPNLSFFGHFQHNSFGSPRPDRFWINNNRGYSQKQIEQNGKNHAPCDAMWRKTERE